MITKRTPPVIGNVEMTRVVRDIYEVLNELIDVVGKYETSPPDQSKGRAGEMRVIKMDDNTYHVSVKSAEGWVVSVMPGSVLLSSANRSLVAGDAPAAYDEAAIQTIIDNIYVALNTNTALNTVLGEVQTALNALKSVFEFQERI